MNNTNNMQPVHNLSGRVVHGRGIGKKAGMPTANLEIAPGLEMPDLGVYAAKIHLDGKELIGVTNVGRRPTVDNDTDISIETYIIDFDGNIYGETMCLKLFKLLRKQQKFDDISLLLEQLKLDCAEAKKYFGV